MKVITPVSPQRTGQAMTANPLLNLAGLRLGDQRAQGTVRLV
jgi:hypothetical protein